MIETKIILGLNLINHPTTTITQLEKFARRAPLIGQNGSAATARLFFRNAVKKKRCDKGSWGLGQEPQHIRAPTHQSPNTSMHEVGTLACLI